MAELSTIEWTDATWNPVRGCTKVSPGCKHCYAERHAERFRGAPGHPYEQGFDLRLVPDSLDLPLTWTRPRRIFVNSMSDLFQKGVPDEFIFEVFRVMHRAGRERGHTFQLLTKRSKRMADFCARLRLVGEELRFAHHGQRSLSQLYPLALPTMPWVWLGVSAENRRYYDKRVEDLCSIELAGVRFVSAEPLLGPIELGLRERRLGWVIAGGESGPRARVMDARWARSIRNQCVKAEVSFFFKQWGGPNKSRTGRTLDERTWDQMPPAWKVPRVLAPASAIVRPRRLPLAPVGLAEDWQMRAAGDRS